MIISVDLAARRYRDIGIARMYWREGSPFASFIEPAELGLSGTPDPEVLARSIVGLARDCGASLLLLDGPQGWKDPRSSEAHMRACERQTRTPGKTGLPGQVKPASWTRMAVFSITVFEVLATEGWPRFGIGWNGDARAIESFPTHAWRALGLQPLPGKKKRGPDVSPWIQSLTERTGLRFERTPSHDELQAAIAGLAGLELLSSGVDSCDVAGKRPFPLDGYWREGLIVSPR